MVKVAVAGGTGSVGRHLIDAIRETGKHDVLALTRKDSPALKEAGINFKVVDYNEHASLVSALEGVHTVICNLSGLSGDGWDKSQSNLLKAAIDAGAKRFVPSEYAGLPGVIPFLPQKELFVKELEAVNTPKQVIEYTLFLPGFFSDYFAYPHMSHTYLTPMRAFADFENAEALVVGTGDEPIVLTSVRDFAKYVARALDVEVGKWPVISGIVGERTTLNEVVKLGEEIRGRPFKVHRNTVAEVEAGTLSWLPDLGNPHIPSTIVKPLVIAFCIAFARGKFDIPPTLNERFPDIKPVTLREYMSEVWKGKD